MELPLVPDSARATVPAAASGSEPPPRIQDTASMTEATSGFAEGAFVVELDRFEGPLDLLLHLIREQDIDIFDIPIAQITRQFLQAIAGVETLGLDRAGEFLELAATLVRIKAQMLLPRRP